ncbi:DUF6978 family protein [Methanolapillus millepedarum]|uniref:Uncharacterized protein n=1 Tax=Methanolapillus millepedarum TaxID=3028296 RepID=A0AA96V4B1_9EURY|nr:hypothetical protein MsAc7_15200 [Methanosarcinaceae archaeon Ac7]
MNKKTSDKSNSKENEFPQNGKRFSIDLESLDGSEKFILDINRGNINSLKITYQTRWGNSIPLVRVDLNGPPHKNPDGVILNCPHVHIFKEKYRDQWA